VEFEYPSIRVSYFVWKIANLGNSDTSTGACVVSGGHVPGKGRCRQHAAQDNELLSKGQHSALFLPLQTVRENQGRQTAKKVGKKVKGVGGLSSVFLCPSSSPEIIRAENRAPTFQLFTQE
jgi:hypothetical protein